MKLGIPILAFCDSGEDEGAGAEASSSAPLQQGEASSHTNPSGSPCLSDQFPILRMASPELREMQEQWRDEEDERSSSAREMPGPSNAGPSNPAPISIPVSAISQDLIWGNLVQNNFSLETSLRNRILRLNKSPFLLGKTVEKYWSDIKLELAEAPSQKEYNRLTEFENRDLLIRELKHESLTLLNRMLTEYPTLREKAPYNPEECLIDFLNEKEELTPEWDPVKKDERNLALLKDLIKDSFPETTKTDSETAVERGLLLLIYGVLLSLAKPYIPLSEGSCSRKKKASLPNQSDQSPGKNVASPDLKMLLGEGGKRAKRGSEGGKMDEVEVTLAPKTSWKKNLPIFFLDESRGT
ncbi:hypothetical protein L1987_88459 [Smallanthus sonchifolius]|nr:hypothetical protein L1987_88459 [Smallanthus sonchifolius]